MIVYLTVYKITCYKIWWKNNKTYKAMSKCHNVNLHASQHASYEEIRLTLVFPVVSFLTVTLKERKDLWMFERQLGFIREQKKERFQLNHRLYLEALFCPLLPPCWIESHSQPHWAFDVDAQSLGVFWRTKYINVLLNKLLLCVKIQI